MTPAQAEPDIEEEEDPHDSLADPAACGLAAALLLFFAVVLVRAAGTGSVPAILSVAVEIEFLERPQKPFAVEMSIDRRRLCAVADGTMRPGNAFASGEGKNRDIDLFAKEPQSAFYVTGPGAETSLTLTADPLPQPGKPPVWKSDLTIEFPRAARPVELRWSFGDAKVKSVSVRPSGAGVPTKDAAKRFEMAAGQQTFAVSASETSVRVVP